MQMSQQMRKLLDATKVKIEDVELCQGITIDKTLFDVKEARIKSLLIKGFIVYLLTMGAMGCYLTAIDCSFNEALVNVVILLAAIGSALLYYSYVVENVAYIFVFAAYIGLVYVFKDYVNSGFYAVVNDTIEQASIYLNVDGMQQYGERISNRTLAITIAMMFIGSVVCIFLNVYISRRMQYIVALITVLSVNIIPLYIEREPDTIYEIMLLTGIVFTYIMKGGKHYTVMSLDNAFLEGKKKSINYIYNAKSVWQTLAYGLVIVFLVVSVICSIYPKDSYDAKFEDDKYKVTTMETMTNLVALGLGGLFNYYDSTGGMASGELGGVSAVHLDYQTDLEVKITPYSFDGVYLKNFTGQTYMPYSNRWMQPKDVYDPLQQNQTEANALKATFEEGNAYSAKGKMIVKNVDAYIGTYLPYYAIEEQRNMAFVGLEKEIEYYPFFIGNPTRIEDYKLDKEYLTVPAENLPVIQEFCEKAGFSDNKETIIGEVINYFQENIPYTVRPGATPRRDDFINYFLMDNQKGYCAHFASAATLIFRYYGIPARYVEGYAFSYNDILDGELVEDTNYSDYYEGYNYLGETALVKVDVTDADAHAWVEVYLPEYGWMVVDVTPSSNEEDTVDFWSEFRKFMNDSGLEEVEVGDSTDADNVIINDNTMKAISVVALLITLFVISVIVVRVTYPVITDELKYKKSTGNERVVLTYKRFIKKIKKDYKDIAFCVNTEEELEFIKENNILDLFDASVSKLSRLLDKAEYSNKNLSEDELRYIYDILNSYIEKKK